MGPPGLEPGTTDCEVRVWLSARLARSGFSAPLRAFRSRERKRISAAIGRSPIPLYERYGFVRTGDIVFDDEVLLWLDL